NLTIDPGSNAGSSALSAAATGTSGSGGGITLAAGALNAAGVLTNAGPIVAPGSNMLLISPTDIVSASGAGAIDVSSTNGNGGTIYAVAGANYTFSGGNTIQLSAASNGGTATGGKIDFNTTPITSLTTKSTGTNGTGGALVFAAYAGSGTGAGTITLPTS